MCKWFPIIMNPASLYQSYLKNFKWTTKWDRKQQSKEQWAPSVRAAKPAPLSWSCWTLEASVRLGSFCLDSLGTWPVVVIELQGSELTLIRGFPAKISKLAYVRFETGLHGFPSTPNGSAFTRNPVSGLHVNTHLPFIIGTHTYCGGCMTWKFCLWIVCFCLTGFWRFPFFSVLLNEGSLRMKPVTWLFWQSFQL